MLNKTLSAMTAIVIGVSGLSAEAMDKSVSVSINPDLGSKKSVVVVDTSSTPNIVAPVAQTTQPRRVVQQPRVVAPIPSKPTAVQVMRPATSSAGYADTIVYASGAKNYYEVGESIKIKLKLKRRAFKTT